MVQLIVDGRKIEADPGRKVLEICLQHGIYIPHLCFLENETEPSASCRLCFVEVQGQPAPLPACSLAAEAGMHVRTDTPAVRRMQRSALRMLLSVHDVDCKNCHANRSCALQSIARHLKVGLKAGPLQKMLKPSSMNRSHPAIDYYPNRCVLCGRCVKICRSRAGKPIFTFSGRGFTTTVSAYEDQSEQKGSCESCGRCVAVCPVGALQVRASSEVPRSS